MKIIFILTVVFGLLFLVGILIIVRNFDIIKIIFKYFKDKLFG